MPKTVDFDGGQTRKQNQDPGVAGSETRIEQAEARTAQAETRTEQARTRTEMAEPRTEQAETALQRAVNKQFPLREMTDTNSPLEELSGRQREILQLIAEGQNTKQIAEFLKVSPKTVEYHRMKLMDFLN